MSREPVSKRRQPQRLPPPLMHGADALEGTAILGDFPDDAGLLFWKTVRTVRLWAELPAAERAHAFQEESHSRRKVWIGDAPAEVRDALAMAAAVLQPRARSTKVARGCREMANWAVSQRALATAIEFMQAAAVATPGDAEAAHEVARLARAAGDHTRAETWYRQAISRARRGATWYEFARSYIGLGSTYTARDNFPAARKSLIRGLRAARRFSMRGLAATAYHELMLLAIHSGRAEDVARMGRSALQAYGRTNQRAATLASDYASYLLDAGHADEALRILLAVPPGLGTPAERLARAAATAEAATLLGRSELYDRALKAAEELLAGSEAVPHPPAALQRMVRAAEAAGAGDRARDFRALFNTPPTEAPTHAGGASPVETTIAPAGGGGDAGAALAMAPSAAAAPPTPEMLRLGAELETVLAAIGARG